MTFDRCLFLKTPTVAVVSVVLFERYLPVVDVLYFSLSDQNVHCKGEVTENLMERI